MIIDGTNIKMTRGDTEEISLSCKDVAGIKIDFVNGDIVRLTVKKDINNSTRLIQKEISTFVDGNAIIIIEPNDTKDLRFGKYKYDIQYNRVNGTVKTIIKPSIFEVEGEVTYE